MEEFSNFEQQLFVSSFYCYLKYDKWLGFTQKIHSKRLLEKNFKLEIDYIFFALGESKAITSEELNITQKK